MVQVYIHLSEGIVGIIAQHFLEHVVVDGILEAGVVIQAEQIAILVQLGNFCETVEHEAQHLLVVQVGQGSLCIFEGDVLRCRVEIIFDIYELDIK